MVGGGWWQCADLRETAEVMSKVGFKMFLGVAANVAAWNQVARPADVG